MPKSKNMFKDGSFLSDAAAFGLDTYDSNLILNERT